MEHNSFDINLHGSGYNIAVMVVTGLVFGITVSNSVYFSRLSEKPSESIGKSTANIMMIMNIMISLLLGAIFLWASYKLIVSEESKYHTMSKYIHKTKESIHKIRNKTRDSLTFLDNIDHHDSHYGHHLDHHDSHYGHHLNHHDSHYGHHLNHHDGHHLDHHDGHHLDHHDGHLNHHNDMLSDTDFSDF